MGKLARQAISEAASVQGRMTGGEIMSSHIIEQTHFGWTVHTCHPNEADPEPVRGRVPDLDRLVQSPRGTNRMRMRRRAQEQFDDTKRARVREQTRLRDAARAAVAAPIDWSEYFPTK